jgi:citrate synthase
MMAEAEKVTDAAPGVQEGLAGVVSHRSAVSTIEDATLTYRGIDINELAEKSTFEEVVCLLWDGKLPAKPRLTEMRAALSRGFEVPGSVEGLLRSFPAQAHPMRVLQAAIAALGAIDPDSEDNSPAANGRKALRLVPQVTAAVCAFHRIRGGKELVRAAPDLNFAGNFFLLLNGRRPDPTHVEAFDKALILHADHELNASTFAARVAASTLADMHSALSAAVGTLKGPLHGGANEAVMAMLKEIGSVDRVRSWVERKLERGEKVMGIGHRVYKNGDPRARHLKEMSRRLCQLAGEPHWFEMSVLIEDFLRERKGLLPNVDFYSATTYYCLGIPPDLYTPIFACSRVAGWIAHLLEQYADNALIRPRALYTGPRGQHWVPLDRR